MQAELQMQKRHRQSSGGSRKKERGVLKSIEREARVVRSREARFFWVTPTSGEVRLGKIPFSARGSPILGCRIAASDLPQLVKLLSQLLKT